MNGVTGIECPNCDYIAYADAINKLSNDPLLRNAMGKEARQRILDNFTSTSFKTHLIELIESL